MAQTLHILTTPGTSGINIPMDITTEYTLYFLLGGAGGNAMSAGGGAGGVILLSVVLPPTVTIIYTRVAASGQGNQESSYITLLSSDQGGLPINPTTPRAWSGDNSTPDSGGAGGSWAPLPPMSLTDVHGNSYPVTYNIVTEANGGIGNASNGLGGKSPYDFNNFPGDTSNLLSNYNVVGGGGDDSGTPDFGAPGVVIISFNNPIPWRPRDTSWGYSEPPPSSNPPCFPEGTTIMTPEGYKAVETLEQGSLVTTAANKIVPIKNIYKTVIKTATATNAPYLIPKHSLGTSPSSDLRLSPQHAFQVHRDVWVSPKYAAELTDKIQQYGIGEPITYYHVECPNFFKDNLIVDGTVVESYGTNQTKGMKAVYVYSPVLKAFTRVASRNTTYHRLSQ